ncbi:MAG: hypothetical protein QW400_01980 [Candidatus Diapherotrites archaeon]
MDIKIKNICLILFISISAVFANADMPFKTQFSYEKIYELKADGTIITKSTENVVISESLEDKAQVISAWERDCTSEQRKTIQELLDSMERLIQAPETDENNKRILTDIGEAYKVMIRVIECKLKANPDGNTADVNYFAKWSPEDIETINKGLSAINKKEYFAKIEKRENIIIVKIPRPKEAVKKMKFLVEGKLIQMIPTYHEKDGNYYVIKDANKIRDSEIYVTFRPMISTPAPAVTQTATAKKISPTPTEGKTDKNSVNLFGTELPIKPNDLFWLVAIIIGLIGILIVAAFVRMKIKSEKEGLSVKREKELVTWAKKEELPGKSTLGTERESAKPKKTFFAGGEITSPASKPLPKENDVFVETKPYVAASEKPKPESTIAESKDKFEVTSDKKMEIVEAKETDTKKEELSEADLKTIERAIAALEPTKAKYQPEQLRKVMLEMGYKEHVAEYIINKLYKK